MSASSNTDIGGKRKRSVKDVTSFKIQPTEEAVQIARETGYAAFAAERELMLTNPFKYSEIIFLNVSLRGAAVGTDAIHIPLNVALVASSSFNFYPNSLLGLKVNYHRDVLQNWIKKRFEEVYPVQMKGATIEILWNEERVLVQQPCKVDLVFTEMLLPSPVRT